jgi:predicted RNase H-like HicB family nuclease
MVVVVFKDGLDGGFVATCLSLPGAMSQGETQQEALVNLADAISGVQAAAIGTG